MKKLSYLTLLAFLPGTLIILSFTQSNPDFYSVNGSSGAAAGYSGDPAGGNKNCTSCHSGPEAALQEGWITGNIPETGYVPGTTYTITAKAEGPGHDKFGFQVSPQDVSGQVMGTMSNTGSSSKLISGGKYITHTSSGNSGSNSISWSFDWTAPEAGSGDVTFYGAFNLADNSGSTSGDTIMLSTYLVSESGANAMTPSEVQPELLVYPNPAQEYLVIETGKKATPSVYTVYDRAGRMVIADKIPGTSEIIPVDHLAPGLYYIRLEGTAGKAVPFFKE